jgi:hypothetical protein
MCPNNVLVCPEYTALAILERATALTPGTRQARR